MEYASFAYQVGEKTSGGRKLKERSWQTTTTEGRYWKRRAGHSWRQWLDGRRGLTTVFKDIPVQICQFHQMKQVTKYSPEAGNAGRTRRTGIMPGFRGVMKRIHKTALIENDHGEIFTDKTYILGTRRWYYTHKKVRSAYLSLERNLPYLFTYLRYPNSIFRTPPIA